MRLTVTPGEGRVHRLEGAVAFCPRPIPELRVLLESSDDKTLFQRLAALVVSTGFESDPFVVIRTTEAPAVFVVGDITVIVCGDSIDGHQASTWVERPLPEEFTIEAGDNSQLVGFDDCELIAGTIGAAGFALSEGTELPTPQPSEQAPAADEVVAERPPAEARATADPPTTEVAAEQHPAVRSETPNETGVEPASDDYEDKDEYEDDFDPFAEPDLVNLEMIGAVAAPEDEVAPSDLEAETDPDLADETLLPEVVEEADDDETAATSQPSGIRPPPTAIPPATASRESSTPIGLRPAPTSLTPVVDEPAKQEPAVEPLLRSSGAATLRIDDGQEIQVGSGVYVGRYPSKQGLPEGFGEVVVKGEDISRVHWALVAEMSGAFAAEDLGSTSGTRTVGPDGIEQPLNPGARRIIGSGTKIIFGDRWALFER